MREVREALTKDGWTDVATTQDVQLDAEQYYVSMAVDMAIAERAEVFVGNGVRLISFLDSCVHRAHHSWNSFRACRPTWSCCD